MDTHDTSTKKPSVRRIHFLTPVLLQSLAWPFGRLALNFFTRLNLQGKENLKKAIAESRQRGVGVIFVLNHTHELDPVCVLVGTSPLSPLFPMFYLTHDREKYSDKKGLGWRRHLYSSPLFFTLWGAHPYIASQRDYQKSMPYHERILKMGKSVCIFPEGKIKEGTDSTPRKVRGGVAYLTEATNAVVVPVTISGIENISMSEFFTRKRTLKVVYGTPLHSDDINDTILPVPERYQHGAQKIMDIVHTSQ